MAKFRVRFAPNNFTPDAIEPQVTCKPSTETPRRRYYKGRYGCRECKQSRSRCDEAYPICLRCLRRGLVCHAAAREQQWQIQLPGFTVLTDSQAASTRGENGSCSTVEHDKYLLRYWLEKASRILVPSEDENPFAYPIVEHLSTNQSMLHTIRSISSAHQYFFEPGQVHHSLEERIKAITALRVELSTSSQQLHALFLSVYLLGVSSSYLDHQLQDFGQEHLEAARIIVNLILSVEASHRHPLTRLIVGTFVYWDMSCAFLSSPANSPVADLDSDIYSFITEEMVGFSHPITGPCTELFFVLSILGRYIRHIMTYENRNHTFELILEAKLSSWRLSGSDSQVMWSQTGEAFRKHGLIMLYRFCFPERVDGCWKTGVNGECYPHGANQLTRQYAIDIMESLSTIPVTSTHLALQPIPLLTAGAELTVEDGYFQSQCKLRLLCLYSCSRIPTNLAAARLLDRIWQLRARRENTTWLEHLIKSEMKLRIG